MLVLIVVTPSLEDMVRDIVMHSLPRDLPPSAIEEVVRSTLGITRVAVLIAPVAEVIQYVLIGAVFGLVKGVFRVKLKLDEVTSAITAGVLHILLLGILPILILFTLYTEIVEVISKYFNLHLAVAVPGVVFTLAIVLISSLRGPWTKLTEARPKEV